MLAILEPIAFPETMSGAPCATAKREEISSGREVPAAIIVTPIIKGDRPIASPIRSELFKNQSAPLSITASDTINTIIQIHVMASVYLMY